MVVTASRVEEKLSDTATTISVINEEEIEKDKYRSPDETLRRIMNNGLVKALEDAQNVRTCKTTDYNSI